MTGTRRDPALSVVICSLGTAQVEETVASVLSAAERAGAAVEVTVVWQAEGSPPALPAEVEHFAIDPLGVSHARNCGLAAAAAPVVAFVDDDELVDAGWAGALLAALAPGEAAAAFGPVEPLDDRGLPYCYLAPGVPRVFVGRAVPPWVVGTGGNMAFDREVLQQLGGFDVRLGAGAEGRSAEESDVIVRLLRARHRILWVPEMGVYHPTKDASEQLASRFPYGFGMGRVVRKHRAPGIGVRYLTAALQSYAAGWRNSDPRRRREALATLRGFLAGVSTPVRR